MESLSDRIRQFLSSHHLKLNTDLGQHFLVDETVLDRIVETASIEPTDHIVEIGPGIGVLTERLLEKGGKVTSIELDERLIPLVQSFVRQHLQPTTCNKLTLISGNALHTSLPTESYKIVANIPYHITSPLLRHAFLESKRPPTSLTLLIQREVAEKICDKQHAGLLTIMVGLFGEASYIVKVPPSSFLPPPAVDSAVVHIRCHPKPLADTATIEAILRLTKQAFGQKRKMLRNSVGQIDGGMDVLEKTGIDPTRRPETLSIEEWITIAGAFSSL